MGQALGANALDQIFRTARTRNGWTDALVTPDDMRAIYDLAKMGPTSANISPARFVWVASPEAREKLAALAIPGNAPKVRQAPVTVIIGHDLDFAEKVPQLFPHNPGAKDWFEDPHFARVAAFRNGSLQGAYLILAARALGLDCGPMSGFDNARLDAAFFPDGRYKSNFLCNLGYGDPAGIYPRNPRLEFDDACRIA